MQNTSNATYARAFPRSFKYTQVGVHVNSVMAIQREKMKHVAIVLQRDMDYRSAPAATRGIGIIEMYATY